MPPPTLFGFGGKPDIQVLNGLRAILSHLWANDNRCKRTRCSALVENPEPNS